MAFLIPDIGHVEFQLEAKSRERIAMSSERSAQVVEITFSKQPRDGNLLVRLGKSVTLLPERSKLFKSHWVEPVAYLKDSVTGREGDVPTTLKTSICLPILGLGILMAAINVHLVLTVCAFVAALVALHLLLTSRPMLYTGYLEDLNSDLPTTRQTLKALFNAAHKSIRILSGQLSPLAYFNSEIFDAWRDAIENRNVSVEIVLGEPHINLDSLKGHVEVLDGSFWDEFKGWMQDEQIVVLRTRRRAYPPHFIVVDGKHVRVEEPHPV